MITLKINGEQHSLDVEAEMPLLWAIRNEIGLTGTKYGCGIAQCGACTVLMDGKAGPLLLAAGLRRPRQGDHHHRRPFARRHLEQGAGSLDRGRRAAMRLLPVRPDHVGHRAC